MAAQASPDDYLSDTSPAEDEGQNEVAHGASPFPPGTEVSIYRAIEVELTERPLTGEAFTIGVVGEDGRVSVAGLTEGVYIAVAQITDGEPHCRMLFGAK